jgi:hypothetical protein
MSQVITTGNYPKALKATVMKWIGLQEDQYPAIYSQYFHKVNSQDMYEEYTQSIGPGMASVKAQGQAMAMGTSFQGQTMRLTNALVAIGLQITYEEILNNKYPVLAKQRALDTRDSLRETKEFLHALVTNNAFNAAYAGMDGMPLCSTAHVTASGLTMANTPTVSAGLSEKTLEDMITLAGAARNDKNFVQRLDAMKLKVSNADQFRATRILKSVKQSGTTNNDPNAIRELGMLPGGLIVDKYQTSNAWGVITSIRDGEGFITQQRQEVQTREDNVSSTLDFLMYAFEYYSCGFVNWRCYYGANAS